MRRGLFRKHHKKLNVREGLFAFAVSLALGPLVVLFREFPYWPASGTGWLYVAVLATIMASVIALWVTLVGSAEGVHRSPLGFSFWVIPQALLLGAMAFAFFVLMQWLFPELQEMHMKRLW
jgi:hypothetical protein